jgi:NAD(P)-dependent dehydrogenase (short-subunit alcohol dehydrogenase family)
MSSHAHHGRTVLVTGAGGGIGAVYVRALTAAGANVVAADLPATADPGTENAEKATAAGPGRAVFTPVDITDDTSLAAAVEVATTEFGGLDGLLNNAAIYAGLGPKKPLTELTTDEWDRVLTVNVRGAFQAVRAAVPALTARGGGRIVLISSTVARTGPAGFAHYVASKAAVEGLARAAARELGPAGITVNCVAPGLVSNEGTRAVNSEDYIARVAGTRSVPREMAPDDLVGAALWLVGPDSGFVSGQTVVVDGGGVFV